MIKYLSTLTILCTSFAALSMDPAEQEFSQNINNCSAVVSSLTSKSSSERLAILKAHLSESVNIPTISKRMVPSNIQDFMEKYENIFEEFPKSSQNITVFHTIVYTYCENEVPTMICHLLVFFDKESGIIQPVGILNVIDLVNAQEKLAVMPWERLQSKLQF